MTRGERPGLVVEAAVATRDVLVGLEVAPGETVALLGPNGSGKSTVLGVIAGLVAPSGGRVSLGGRALDGVPPHRRRTALLAQEALLFPHLSAVDNIAFGPRCAGRRRRAARATAQEWLARVGAEDLADHRPAQLSGGQAQRVALARALATDPELLLLDEPMAALDADVAPGIRRLLRTVLADRTTLLVTHDALDALLLADRVVVVERGRVVEHGPTREVLTRPRSEFAARVAGLNLVAGRWRGGAVVHPSLSVTGLSPDGGLREGDEAVAVFSPSAVAVFERATSGSPRTGLDAIVTEVEPFGDRVRVRTVVGDVQVAADVTPASVAELALAPGSAVHLLVKAVEVAVHGARRG